MREEFCHDHLMDFNTYQIVYVIDPRFGKKSNGTPINSLIFYFFCNIRALNLSPYDKCLRAEGSLVACFNISCTRHGLQFKWHSQSPNMVSQVLCTKHGIFEGSYQRPLDYLIAVPHPIPQLATLPVCKLGLSVLSSIWCLLESEEAPILIYLQLI